MKVYQTVRECFFLIEFHANEYWFDINMLVNIIKSILGLSLQCIYLFRVADVPEELMHSIFFSTAGILIFISFSSTVQQMMDIFRLMDTVEKAINKS